MPRTTALVYGVIIPDLVDIPHDATQCSPRVPGATPLGAVPPGSCSEAIVHAPSSVIERRRVLAMALKALAPGAPLVAIAHNTKGGTRLVKELEAFGCEVAGEHKRHHRIARTVRPEHPQGLDEAIADGDALLLPDLGLWSQPGLFNWDRIDPGSELLLEKLPVLTGRGADLGCGFGVLAHAVREKNPAVALHLIDIDARALHMSRLNVPGNNVFLHWADVRTARISPPSPRAGKVAEGPISGSPAATSRLEAPSPRRSPPGDREIVGALPSGLDFVVCNPPFHDAGEEDKSLGQTFIARAAEMLRPGGVLWITANRHLPYEAALRAAFETVTAVADAHGFKVYAATTKARRENESARSGRPAGKSRYRA